MNNNASAELTSTVSKIQMLRDEITSDIKNGMEFHSLIPVSARTYFGPKWLDKILGRMDSMEIFKHSEKDGGLIPYDLILSGMIEAKGEYHDSSHEDRNNVMLHISGKNFEGKVPVLSADNQKAVLGMAWKSSFSGTFVNAKDIEPAEKEIETLQQKLNQIMQQLTATEQVAEDMTQEMSDKKEAEPVNKFEIPGSPVIIPSRHAVHSYSKFPGYAMLSIGLCFTLYSLI